jgi:hypothetical protein
MPYALVDGVAVNFGVGDSDGAGDLEGVGVGDSDGDLVGTGEDDLDGDLDGVSSGTKTARIRYWSFAPSHVTSVTTELGRPVHENVTLA